MKVIDMQEDLRRTVGITRPIFLKQNRRRGSKISRLLYTHSVKEIENDSVVKVKWAYEK